MIAGIRWVRGAVPSAVHDEVEAEKKKVRITWDDLLADALRGWVDARRAARMQSGTGTDPFATRVDVPLASPQPVRVNVVDIAPTVADAVVEPQTIAPLLTVPTADEIMRSMGHPDFQHGIPLAASAVLMGAAAVTADGR